MIRDEAGETVDVAIVGGGVVGLALAGLLAQSTPLRLALIESTPSIAATIELSPLVSALNHASEALLQQLGVWSLLLPELSPYRQMRVWQAVGAGELSITAASLNLPHLGHILNNQRLRQILWQWLQQYPSVQQLVPARVQSLYSDKSHVRLTLEDGRMITAGVLVAADGCHSWVRQQLAVPLTFYDYGQQALVATLCMQHPHQQTAYQLFHEDSIVALLPLADPHHCSLVWSLPSWRANQLLAETPQRFSHQLNAASDRRLGDNQLVSSRQVFHLQAQYARQFVRHRVVLIGDAAHTIHPLTGQGLNLGLADVVLLVNEWQRLQGMGKDIGADSNLRHFERQRKYQAAKLLAFTHGIQRLFQWEQPLARWLRGAALQSTNKSSLLKNYWVRQASGFFNRLMTVFGLIFPTLLSLGSLRDIPPSFYQSSRPIAVIQYARGKVLLHDKQQSPSALLGCSLTSVT